MSDPEACQSRIIDRGNTHLSKVTRMVLVKHDPVVMLATSITPTTGMFSVLSDTAMARTDVTTLLSVLPQACTRDNS